MAMNLRLRPEAAAALKAESARTGLSQQEILREAVDERLGIVKPRATRRPDWVDPPREPFRDVRPRITLPAGATIIGLLDELREDRL